MTQQKKIWELQHTTICKVVGMALDFEDLKKVGHKFGLVVQDSYGDKEFAVHSAVVGLCGKESRLSRHVQRLIKKRFSPYALRLSQRAAAEITELALHGTGAGGVPLWAILWYLVTTGLSDGAREETALFARIHMLEHKLLKDFWSETAADRDERENRYKEEIDSLRRELLGLQSLTLKLKKENLRLTTRLSTSCPCLQSPAPVRTTNRRVDCTNQDRRIERLRLLLGESRKKNQELAEEYAQSKKQIESLAQELIAYEQANFATCESPTAGGCSCPLKHCLQGKRIAMVGGIASLEAHYRSLVEESGGEFRRHDGRCSHGERKLEECIRTADLVVCPVSVNSHFGATGVKKVCRRYGIRCCFLDSAGLGALRAALLQHFDPDREASGASI